MGMTTKAQTKRSAQRIHHHVMNTVVPRAHNGYHPHMIRWQGIVLVLATVFGLQLMNGLPVNGAVLGSSTDLTSERLLAATNKERLARQVEPLVIDDRLNEAAELKAYDMLAKQYWSHVSPSGVTPWQWFEVAGYEYAYAGENLGKGFRSPEGVVRAWMDSSEHRHNLLQERYQDVGFAVAHGMLNGEETNLIVALYGSEKTNPAFTSSGVLAATSNGSPLLTRLGVGLRSLPPAALAAVTIASLAVVVSLATHLAHGRTPRVWRRSWHRHHGLYKAVGMTVMVVVIVALYGGGQI